MSGSTSSLDLETLRELNRLLTEYRDENAKLKDGVGRLKKEKFSRASRRGTAYGEKLIRHLITQEISVVGE